MALAKNRSERTSVKIVRTRNLKPVQVDAMFAVMEEYYHGVERTSFDKDLAESESVILLLSSDGAIQGFSTFIKCKIKSGGRSVIALFSGDTVLRCKYWGNGALGTGFCRLLFKSKLRHPFAKVYWFLSSKGYKTYLLMTNNFPVHYPRFNVPTPPHVRELMNQFYGARFGAEYDPDSGLVLALSANPCRLQQAIAEIGPRELANPKINFFAAQNPDWNQGVELACVAEVSILIPFTYGWKQFRKRLMARADPWQSAITARDLGSKRN